MTPTEIANLALSRLMAPPISDILEDLPEARICRAHYESVRDALLRAHPWAFATTRAELTPGPDPAFGWAFAYRLPADFVRLNSFNGRDARLCENDYTIEGAEILTNAKLARITYVRQVVDPNEFDATFTDALVLKLAAAIAMELTGDSQRLADMETLAELKLANASFADAMEARATVSDPLSKTLIMARRSYDLGYMKPKL